MKYKTCYEVIADSYEEEQFIIKRFPEALWFITDSHVKIYIPKSAKNELVEAISQWRDYSKYAGSGQITD